MTYILYETTNLINGKYYIGVHKLNGKNYLGSGKLISLSVKKYGRKNFMRETLKEFDNSNDAYLFEKEVVDDKMVNNNNCYNLIIGGIAPPLHCGKTHWNYGGNMSKETLKKMSIASTGKTASEETKKKLSLAGKGRLHSEESKKKMSLARMGKTNSEESKKKQSLSMTGKYVGKNSATSKIWTVYGEVYYSLTEASKHFGVGRNTIKRWCDNGKYSKEDCYVQSKESK